MQLSADVPHGPKAIAEYLASGQTQGMNVPKEADRAFLSELKKSDPKRWAALDKEMQSDFYRRQRNPEGADATAA